MPDDGPAVVPPARRGARTGAMLVLVAGLAFLAGWALRGAFTLERIDGDRPLRTEAALDTGAAPSTARGDTMHVSRDEAAVARPAVRPDPVMGPGGLVMPVQGVRPQDLVDTYTSLRGIGRSHDAIDILAPRGTPVLAAAAGRVLRLFRSDRGGLTVYILTGPDRRTVHYYAHLDSYAPGLSVGDEVRAGQVLGGVGDSGNAVPGNTHLHFAIWRIADPADFWEGAPVNPYPLLRGEGSQ